MTDENPIATAARAIKDLHQQNVDLIDGGHIFSRDGVDVSAIVREASVEQIKICDALIEQAPQLAISSEQNQVSITDIIHELEEIKTKRAVGGGDYLPEIGNYGHEET